MLLIPVDRKIDWRHPPVLTFLLIALNVAVFAVFQHNDHRAWQQAVDYYFGSNLPELELRRYAESKGEPAPTDTDAQARLFGEMLQDGAFVQRLRAGEIIGPADAEYQDWRFERTRYEELLSQSVSQRFGLKPGDPAAADLLAHMFLHGGAGHLIGNMIFLFIFGFVVEAALGRWVFLGAYLLAGLASAAFDFALQPDRMIPGIGASGAIAGLMGMYTALFGLRRIRFFYSVLFYFDYVRAPAIILLPLWLGWEIAQELFAPSSVNRIAHIGGLLGGALIGYAARRYSPSVDHGYLDAEERNERRRKDYAEGLDLLAAMELERARAIFERLLADDPADRNVLLQLYNIAKFDPGSETYHQFAHRILNLPGKDAATLSLVHDIYREYVRIARPAYRFRSEELLQLALRFAAGGYLDGAEGIVAGLLQGKRDWPRNAEALLALALGFRRAGEQDKYRRSEELLLKLYPDSAAAEHLRRVSALAGEPNSGTL